MAMTRVQLKDSKSFSGFTGREQKSLFGFKIRAGILDKETHPYFAAKPDFTHCTHGSVQFYCFKKSCDFPHVSRDHFPCFLVFVLVLE